jgi:hypothetical protein
MPDPFDLPTWTTCTAQIHLLDLDYTNNEETDVSS